MGRRVLVVDDSDSFRRVFVRMLERIDPLAKFDEARHGLEAVRLCSERKYEFVFLDVDMPKMDGWTALKAIQKMDDSPTVFMVSASSKELGEVRALEFGAAGFLSKPIDYSEFVKILKMNLRNCNL